MKHLILTGLILSITHTYAGSSKCQRALEENDYDMVPLCLKIEKLKKELKELKAENADLRVAQETRNYKRQEEAEPVVELQEPQKPYKRSPVTQASLNYLYCMADKFHKDPKTDCSELAEKVKKAKMKWGY